MAAVRIDKWLWAVRVFKTRSLATEACRAGNVKLDGEKLKPSHNVKLNETFSIRRDQTTLIIRVLALLEKRVGAPLVAQYAEDLTPPSEAPKKSEPDFRPVFVRKRGAGRPTKKERRQIEEFLD